MKKMNRLGMFMGGLAFLMAPVAALASGNDCYDCQDMYVEQSLYEDIDIYWYNDVSVGISANLNKNFDIDIKVIGGEQVTQTTSGSESSSTSGELHVDATIDADFEIIKNGGNGGNGWSKSISAHGSGSLDIADSESHESSYETSETFYALTVDGLASAIIDNKQILKENHAINGSEPSHHGGHHGGHHGLWNVVFGNHTNTASVEGDAFSGATGNLAVNVVAGDNNAQDNVAAITSSEMENSLADAEIFKLQLSVLNGTKNNGTQNSASVTGNAFAGATGNIGVNVVSGNNNAQSNMLAVANAPAKVAVATAALKQEAAHNYVANKPVITSFEHETTEFESDISLSGLAIQANNVYLDDWTGNSHPGGSPEGHTDLDYDIQGGWLNPDRSTPGCTDTNNGCVGGLAFDLDLSGTFSTLHDVWIPVATSTSNVALLDGSAFSGATGNIGVNIGAGTGNLQANALSVANGCFSCGTTPPNGGGNGGE